MLGNQGFSPQNRWHLGAFYTAWTAEIQNVRQGRYGRDPVHGLFYTDLTTISSTIY